MGRQLSAISIKWYRNNQLTSLITLWMKMKHLLKLLLSAVQPLNYALFSTTGSASSVEMYLNFALKVWNQNQPRQLCILLWRSFCGIFTQRWTKITYHSIGHVFRHTLTSTTINDMPTDQKQKHACTNFENCARWKSSVGNNNNNNNNKYYMES